MFDFVAPGEYSLLHSQPSGAVSVTPLGGPSLPRSLSSPSGLQQGRQSASLVRCSVGSVGTQPPHSPRALGPEWSTEHPSGGGGASLIALFLSRFLGEECGSGAGGGGDGGTAAWSPPARPHVSLRTPRPSAAVAERTGGPGTRRRAFWVLSRVRRCQAGGDGVRVADVHARTALRSCPAAFSPSLLWDPVAAVWPSPQRTLLTLRGLGAAAAPLLSGLAGGGPGVAT